MGSWRCHPVKWGRRNVLMMTFWYFAVIFSAFLYYTYTKWRPAPLYSAIFDGPVAGRPAGALVVGEKRDSLRWQRSELRWILGESASQAGGSKPRVVGPEDDTSAQVGAPPAAGQPLPLPVRLFSSRDLPENPSRSAPGSGVAAERTRINAWAAGGASRHRSANGNGPADGIAAENEAEMAEMEVEEDDVRYPDTYALDLTTVGFESASLRPTLASVVEGYERISNRQGMRLRCGRCSVVSSSGHLINQSRGRDIDSAQCILRMNSAPTAGYEDDVGARTTVRVIGHVNLLVLNSSRESQEEIFVNPTSRADKIVIPWLHSYRLNKESNIYYKIAKNFSKSFPDVEFYFLTQEKSKMAEEIFKSETGLTTREANTWLTTGWMTLLFAIDVCDEIDIYGLVDEGHCRDHPNDSTPYHYYDPGGIIECKYYQRSEERLTGGHLFITEKAVFARWAQRFNFSFHTPAWNLTSGSAANLSLALETPFLRKFYEARRNNRTVVRTHKVVRRVVRRIVVKRKVPAVKRTKL
ncbi:uncharacterized protein LOC110977683 [Acanthaster planci]|uniref:Uncharacterized protein LOC110977683 n=1 Tax=Acanthaster planci TaxID=133434 RepID=A0A8B7Y7C5_ACAPL|nr:uncharacterized protein LOC110977683 [Acanthaster planci]XP_022087680.1 uncharacterized protein LOC110977683 [Acanthaster planci]XP_022087681.1 uncharacterized protein LOC110977683 [Acanthaster planci]